MDLCIYLYLYCRSETVAVVDGRSSFHGVVPGIYKNYISEFNSEVNQAPGFIGYTLKTKKKGKEKERRRSMKSLCHLWHMEDSGAIMVK